MKPTDEQIKAYAEAKAIEKYPKSFNAFVGSIQREAYAQQEREKVIAEVKRKLSTLTPVDPELIELVLSTIK